MEVLGVFEIPVWTLIIAVIILLVYVHYIKYFTIFKHLRIPGPTPLPFFGNFIEVMKKGMLSYDEEIYNKYKHEKMFGNYFGPWAEMVICDPDILKQVLVKDFEAFRNRRNFNHQTGLLNESLVSLTGDYWKHVRNAVTPTFTSGKLKQVGFQYSDLVNDAADKALVKLGKLADAGDKFETKDFTGGFTLEVIASTAFGLQVDSQNDREDRFMFNAKKAMNFGSSSPVLLCVFLLPTIFRVIKWLFPNVGVSDPTSIQFFTDVTNQALDERKVENAKYKDFLQLMVKAEAEYKRGSPDKDEKGNWIRKGLSRREILAQALIFLFAGYQTTADALSFTMYNLATNPNCMDQLIEEIDDKLGEETPRYENVGRLQYMDQCVNESLRMYPPGFRFDRILDRDIMIGGKLIPKDVAIVVPVWGIHHDSDIYPEPEKFKPERFSAEEKAKRNPYQFLPFGVGPRNCIGMRLAILEIKILLAKIFQFYRLQTCDDTQIPLKLDRKKFLTTEKGAWIKVSKRKC